MTNDVVDERWYREARHVAPDVNAAWESSGRNSAVHKAYAFINYAKRNGFDQGASLLVDALRAIHSGRGAELAKIVGVEEKRIAAEVVEFEAKDLLLKKAKQLLKSAGSTAANERMQLLDEADLLANESIAGRPKHVGSLRIKADVLQAIAIADLGDNTVPLLKKSMRILETANFVEPNSAEVQLSTARGMRYLAQHASKEHSGSWLDQASWWISKFLSSMDRMYLHYDDPLRVLKAEGLMEAATITMCTSERFDSPSEEERRCARSVNALVVRAQNLREGVQPSLELKDFLATMDMEYDLSREANGRSR